MHTVKIKESRPDKVFTIINYTVLSILFVVFLYPLVYIVSASFSSGSAVVQNRVWLWPVDFSLDGYKAVFNHRLIMSGFTNSLLYVTIGTAVNLVMTVMAAYPLSRKDLVGRKPISLLFVFTMLFNSGLIPFYMLVTGLGMRNSFWALIIPSAMSVYNMIVTRSFFEQTIPTELLEASQIDGCTNMKFLLRCVLPLSGPILAVMALFYAVGNWNAYFNALIFIDDPNLYPLQLVLRQILIASQFDFSMMTGMDVAAQAQRAYLKELLKYSLIVVASVPVLIIYPFVQKYFVKGVMIGSLKG